jgi:hypothetical protein
MSKDKFKRISLEEAQKHYYLKPEGVPCNIANAYTLTPVSDQDGWEEVHYWIRKTSFSAKLAIDEGYIYILENKSQPGICKIGYTDRTPQDRVREINNATGVIVPWYISNAFPCKSPSSIERLVHSELSDYWVNKEGFAVTLPLAERTVLSVIAENSAGIA